MAIMLCVQKGYISGQFLHTEHNYYGKAVHTKTDSRT